ncbi:biopolymer transporter ExbD [Bartonella bacilliformis]|uniref:TonB system transport protein ExbD n=2 Tax=Bartonella bacilliformis TaxID=774 RepID=A1URA9_BARBK|nr:TonB system transport protein ExbD [Bartonella bacilliformis KC583]AMG85391.1 biopolymer transporter ExbD [Bartonella bacilliformis]EKS46063.1 biopolymer transport exbD protein [Bartonella bacilliformis INS]EYS89172.1 TonB system transporter ExbD [Bartonella bacilliformis San Pedro600-02]EYS94119.1 TonB system transporter ExbD [Bartonella bacilliformis Peru-18]KEG17865.1 TonB system transporter ExbD [Bartonella bacilliformis Cond044]KEG18240.1 TonB system transporter ExbD [Bartonella bacil
MAMNFRDDWDNAEDFELNNTINVTPFIDVILVLLIVFMVAAPLATSVIPVQLPSVTQEPVSHPDEPLYITLKKDESWYVGNKPVSEADFMEILSQETEQNLETKILINADAEIDYGYVVGVIDRVRMAGYTKIGLVGLQKTANKTVETIPAE